MLLSAGVSWKFSLIKITATCWPRNPTKNQKQNKKLKIQILAELFRHSECCYFYYKLLANKLEFEPTWKSFLIRNSETCMPCMCVRGKELQSRSYCTFGVVAPSSLSCPLRRKKRKIRGSDLLYHKPTSNSVQNQNYIYLQEQSYWPKYKKKRLFYFFQNLSLEAS